MYYLYKKEDKYIKKTPTENRGSGHVRLIGDRIVEVPYCLKIQTIFGLRVFARKLVKMKR